MEERYYTRFAAAVVRGELVRRGMSKSVSSSLVNTALEDLTIQECNRLMEIGALEGFKLYHFKRSDRTLPRVQRVLGFLKSIQFESLLDVGSGRGVFLLPFMESFPQVPVTSLEVLDKRVRLLEDLSLGGVTRLTVIEGDVCRKPLEDQSFDVVTMLEVLEHIPQVQEAIDAACRMARRYVVVTVPSKEDENPEHIHLLTKEKLTVYFTACGAKKLAFEGLPGHLFMIATMGE